MARQATGAFCLDAAAVVAGYTSPPSFGPGLCELFVGQESFRRVSRATKGAGKAQPAAVAAAYVCAVAFDLPGSALETRWSDVGPGMYVLMLLVVLLGHTARCKCASTAVRRVSDVAYC